MDYAFAPGGDKYDEALRTLLRDRKVKGSFETTVLHDPARLKHVAAFFHELDVTVTTKPIGDLLLGSHANDRGWLDIDLDDAADLHVNFQLLKVILNDPVRLAKLRIPPALYQTAQGANAPIKLHLKGCQIGSAQKLVDALKQVFGGVVPVTAPRHFYIAHPWREEKTPDSPGTFEYLDYRTFSVLSKGELSPSQVAADLRSRNPKLQFIDGTNVPDDLWAKVIPEKPTSNRHELTFSTQLGRKIRNRKTWPATGQYRWDEIPTFFTKVNPAPGDDTLARLKAAVKASPQFQAGWGFPIHEQYGHNTPEKYVDAFNWTPTKEVKNGQPVLTWHGSRYEYALLIPITLPPPSIVGKGKKARVKFGKLIYNFYPRPASGLNAVNELHETDPLLFYTTP